MVTEQQDTQKAASLALHYILTRLNTWKYDIGKWDSETWIVFHNLLLFFSTRAVTENWALRVLAYTGGIIPTLEDKKLSGIEISCDPVQVLGKFTDLASYIMDTDRNSMNEGNVRICNALRETRNKLISKEDSAFGHLLTQSGLEITTPYMEGDIHEIYRVSLFDLTENISRYVVKNLQFEVSKQTEDTDVEKALFGYFTKKGFKTQSSGMCYGTVYDTEGNLVWCTSVTVDKGQHNSVAIVSLTR